MKKIIPIGIIIIPVVFTGCTEKVSVTPPDAPPPDGYVFIGSNPQGADIYINNKFTRRVTPDSVNYLTTGSYKITLKKENFRDTSFVVQITEGKRPGVLVDYTKNPLMYGKINCTSTPDSASIILNGEATGKKTPAILDNIFPGEYYVRYQLISHQEDSVKVTVQSSSTVTATKILVDTTVWSVYDYNILNSGLPATNLTGLVVDPSNNVWIGSEDYGLIKFDGNVWQKYPTGSPKRPDNNVKAIAVEQDGTVWAGTRHGLFLIGPAGIESYTTSVSGPLIDFHINFIFTKGDTTYIATDTTFVTSYISGYRIWGIDIHEYPELRGNLGDNSIKFSSICVDNSNAVWLGTEQNGVKNTRTGEIFNTSNSQIGDNINTLAVSPSGVVWIGYNYNLGVHSSVSYYSNGNIIALQMVPPNSNTNTIFIDKNDTKWIGTTKGLVEYSEATGRTVYDSVSTGLNINDVRGIGEDSFGRLWIEVYRGEIFVKKK